MLSGSGLYLSSTTLECEKRQKYLDFSHRTEYRLFPPDQYRLSLGIPAPGPQHPVSARDKEQPRTGSLLARDRRSPVHLAQFLGILLIK